METINISDVIKYARQQGVQVEPEVVTYVAAVLSTEADRVRLTQEVADAVVFRTNAFMDVVELQVGMELAFRQQRQLVQQEHQDQAAQLQVLQQDLMDADVAQYRSFKDYQRLHDAILQHICLSTPALAAAFTDEGAAQQVRAALASVYPVACAAMFVGGGPEERLGQLRELARATLGICCLHQATGSGGHMMPAGLDACIARGHKLMDVLQQQEQRIGAQLEAAAALLDGLPEGEHRQDGLLEMMHRCQVHCYQQLLLADLRSCLGALQLLQQEERRLVEELLLVIGTLEAVPRERVMPLFVSLGATRAAITEEVRLLVVHQRLADSLEQLDQSAVPLRLKAALGSAAAAPEQLPLPRLDSADCRQVEASLPDGWTYVPPTELGAGPALALCGLCPAALAGLASGSGATGAAGPVLHPCSGATGAAGPVLHPCRHSLGCIRAPDGQLYGCHTAAALAAFASNPTGGLAAVRQQAVRCPLLVHLLGLQQQVPHCNLQALLDAAAGTQVLKVDFSTQTPTHFLEQHVDRHYEWNAWVLRRRALALADLKTKRTHSTQTDESHFRRDGQTQVWRPKEVAQQTAVHQGSTMPRKLRFVGGLRGVPSRQLRTATLDLDLGQPRAGSGC